MQGNITPLIQWKIKSWLLDEKILNSKNKWPDQSKLILAQPKIVFDVSNGKNKMSIESYGKIWHQTDENFNK